MQKIEPVSIFLPMTLHTPVKITKCAQYTMEALVPFFTQDAQRQVCFGLKGRLARYQGGKRHLRHNDTRERQARRTRSARRLSPAPKQSTE